MVAYTPEDSHPRALTTVPGSGSAHPQRLIVLGTGGTIAGSGLDPHADSQYVTGVLGVEDLVSSLPIPAGYHLETEQVAQLDSKDMDHETWYVLAWRCVHWLRQDDVAGVVITHGTDTIEETAFFLQCVLPTEKPVVLTCAMRPASAFAPDGPKNLADALIVASSDNMSGVSVVTDGRIHDPRFIQKVHSHRLDAFDSGDAGPCGYVVNGRIRHAKIWPGYITAGSFHIGTLGKPHEWPIVVIVASHAGVCATVLEALLNASEA
ncbi:MAG: asparaginase [Hydrogenophaga sp.]|uniref:asparaginase n=1 Tax=Hydrogenophaga sp. TaxID=1904254 RepID=UPI002634CAAB|nr:asparaginase [Hydrogenophaga sp.]MCV0437452.1 asparaginase [Hydrogenophaga sp.]